MDHLNILPFWLTSNTSLILFLVLFCVTVVFCTFYILKCRKLREDLDEQTCVQEQIRAENAQLTEDNHSLSEGLDEYIQSYKTTCAERDILRVELRDAEKHIEACDKAVAGADRKIASLTTKLEKYTIGLKHHKRYKTDIYREVLNTFIRCKALLWKGDLSAALYYNGDHEQHQTLDNLTKLRAEINLVELRINDVLNTATNRSLLENSILDDGDHEEIVVVIPINKKKEFMQYVYALRGIK